MNALPTYSASEALRRDVERAASPEQAYHMAITYLEGHAALDLPKCANDAQRRRVLRSYLRERAKVARGYHSAITLPRLMEGRTTLGWGTFR